MREIYFGNLRSMVIEYVREVESGKPEANSILWDLLKYLRRIIKVTEPPARPGRVDGAIQSLIRFYIDNIDSARSKDGYASISMTSTARYCGKTRRKTANAADINSK
jgi:hypothetical protein